MADTRDTRTTAPDPASAAGEARLLAALAWTARMLRQAEADEYAERLLAGAATTSDNG